MNAFKSQVNIFFLQTLSLPSRKQVINNAEEHGPIPTIPEKRSNFNNNS